MVEGIENMQSIELLFRASVDYVDGDGSRPMIGQFVGSGRLQCPICGNEDVKIFSPRPLGAGEPRMRLWFSCREGYGHATELAISQGPAPGEVIWSLTGTDDAYDMRDSPEQAPTD